MLGWKEVVDAAMVEVKDRLGEVKGFLTGSDLRESLAALERDHTALLDAMVTDLGSLRARSEAAAGQAARLAQRLEGVEASTAQLAETSAAVERLAGLQRDQARQLEGILMTLQDLQAAQRQIGSQLEQAGVEATARHRHEEARERSMGALAAQVRALRLLGGASLLVAVAALSGVVVVWLR